MSEQRSEELVVRVAGGDGADMLVHLGDGELALTTSDGVPARTIRLDDILEVAAGEDHVQLTLAQNHTLRLQCDGAAALDAAIIDACCTLPELTRGLGSFGSSRAGAQPLRQRAFFEPLLEARRRAEEALARRDIIAAFAGERLSRALDAQVAAIANAYADPRPAARRAIAAILEDAVAPLQDALAVLDLAGHEALAPPPKARIGSWRSWQAALVGVFVSADRCWRALAQLDRRASAAT